ncbi:hypothetical protein LAZ67_22000380 [Cordylochernes scorpioides]|uniref:Transposase n=1 Tax=Cordylochernes scorpioides TaxID=51811 RepID=A0ABY6LT19_9ARAC|nr:hypothetical protein LAZ67_22000380 [Cordylochernes scorpioides]
MQNRAFDPDSRTSIQGMTEEISFRSDFTLPPYSPDLAPTDYHLYRSMSNHMRGTTFNNEENLKTWLNNFFYTRPGEFWRNGINKLVERWEEVVNNNGEYIID